MDTNRVPQPRHDDDSVEAHYACLERPCACMDGWVFVGRLVESEHDLDGEVVEYERVPCRRCAQRSWPIAPPQVAYAGATSEGTAGSNIPDVWTNY
jgi:hypothetical protein